NGGLGNVTMYSTSASNGGACNYGSTKVMYYAAMSVNVAPGDGKGQWQGGRICGQCAEVTALTSQGPKSVVVRIMDKCPDAYCGVDLGGSAPGAVMLDGYGRYDGQWTFVSCTGHPEVSDGPPSLAVLNGSNQWWSRVQVRNPPAAVQSIAWQDASNASTQGTFTFATDVEGSFEVPVQAVLQSSIQSFLITVTYADGSKASVQVSRSQLGAAGSSYPLS
ncbi:MAG TPA: expansin-like protein, partial [Anaeromyxobacteraceae bacterium]|nr:expansin-like protein [Anaeromyxobacteraceae bacterium]